MARKPRKKAGLPRKPTVRPAGRTPLEHPASESSQHVSTVDKVIWAASLLAIYVVISTWGHFDFSDLMGYYDLFAAALLDGRLHIDIRPDQMYIHDMVPFEGRYYIQWGPVPAVPYLFARLAGFPLSDRIACVVTGWLTSLVFLGIILTLQRKYFPEMPKAAVETVRP